jgi:glycosyltransferase involved in cell wall biosynthesis
VRVAVVIPEMGTGGAEVVAATLARHHLARGHEVTVYSHGGWRTPPLVAQGARFVQVPLRGRRVAGLLAAARVMRRTGLHAADLVHAHNVKAALAARLALGLRRSPAVLATAHGFLAPDRGRAAFWLARTADHVVAVSAETADRLREGGYPASRLSVIENAIEEPQAPSRTQARRQLGLHATRPVVLCLARMTGQKRHDLLLRAWHGWDAAPTLLIAGDGPTRPRVERLVRDLRLDDRVQLLGNRQDPLRLISAADVLVLPSDMEGLPISVLEALWLGVPVVASAVGGLRELGGAVTLVPPGESEGFRDAVTLLVSDTAAQERQRNAGRALVRERFVEDRMVEAYRCLDVRR